MANGTQRGSREIASRPKTEQERRQPMRTPIPQTLSSFLAKLQPKQRIPPGRHLTSAQPASPFAWEFSIDRWNLRSIPTPVERPFRRILPLVTVMEYVTTPTDLLLFINYPTTTSTRATCRSASTRQWLPRGRQRRRKQTRGAERSLLPELPPLEPHLQQDRKPPLQQYFLQRMMLLLLLP